MQQRISNFSFPSFVMLLYILPLYILHSKIHYYHICFRQLSFRMKKNKIYLYLPSFLPFSEISIFFSNFCLVAYNVLLLLNSWVSGSKIALSGRKLAEGTGVCRTLELKYEFINMYKGWEPSHFPSLATRCPHWTASMA